MKIQEEGIEIEGTPKEIAEYMEEKKKKSFIRNNIIEGILNQKIEKPQKERKKRKYNRTCKNCGKGIKSKKRQYCSTKCRKAIRAKYAHQYYVENAENWNKPRKKEQEKESKKITEIHCKECNKMYATTDKRKVFCSKRCSVINYNKRRHIRNYEKKGYEKNRERMKFINKETKRIAKTTGKTYEEARKYAIEEWNSPYRFFK